jgi:hypothetical protein
MKKMCITAVAVLLACSASSAFAQSQSSARQTGAQAREEAQAEGSYGKCYTGRARDYATNGASAMMADQDCHGRR